MSLLLHPRTKHSTENYLKRPSHALLLIGEEGIGKFQVAQWLAKELQQPTVVIEAEENKSVITIEQIRDLYSFTKTGQPCVVIVKDAGQMGREAQNAFLKLLEEPPVATKFILTTSQRTALLPTIRSRVQEITLYPPPKKQMQEYARQQSSLTDVELQTLTHISKGLPGRLLTLLQNESTKNDVLNSVSEAKNFYTAAIYDRHLLCIDRAYDREWANNLLDTLALIIGSLLKNTSSSTLTNRLCTQAALIEETAHSIRQINGNLKIHLVKLCQQL